MHIPPTSLGHVHGHHWDTSKRNSTTLNRPGFKFNEACVRQVGSEVCIYFAFCLCMYNILIIASMQDVPYW